MKNKRQGFSLLEIAITLLVIGLITGSILVGQTLIHQARIRATLKQVDKLNSAIGTFVMKYNCLPGDCATISSLLPGMTDGNGDGRIAQVASPSSIYEDMNVPMQLNQSKLLENIELRGGIYRYPLQMTANSTAGDPGGWTTQYMRPMAGSTSMTTEAGHYYWANTHYSSSGANRRPVLLPADAYALDSKLDDGLPLTGSVMASGTNNYTYTAESPNIYTAPSFDPATDKGPPGANSNFCVTNETPSKYNVKNENRVDDTLCSLVVKASF